MDFQELCRARYSLRKFSGRPVEPEKLEMILEAARSAPTAKNLQPQRIFVAATPETAAKAERCTECPFHAPVALIVGYDPAVSWKQVHEPRQDYGAVDASIAVTQMMLQATALGVGNIFIGLFDPAKIYETFPETQGTVPVAVLYLGYPAEGARPARLHGERIPLGEMVRRL